jgi:hypothetical protein
MKATLYLNLIALFLISGCTQHPENATWQPGQEKELYKAPPQGVNTRWASPENPNGDPGKGGTINMGAKGNAFYTIAPGEKQVLLDYSGGGMITRMWMSGTIGRSAEQRRMVRIDMFWDGAEKPAVSAPIGDFFGTGLGLLTPFESDLFASPEGRSFNFTIPMPFRKSAKVVVSNESPYYVLFWYDINFITVDKHPDDLMYFHAFWSRDMNTTIGNDFEILPKVEGTGRYIGTNIGVIGNESYRNTWFGEGEVKIYLDGDKSLPTLVGTGTEDYIGSGWGQGRYYGRYFGSLVSDNQNDLYAFYRYHLDDPVFFHQECKVTIQQMGNCGVSRFQEIEASGAPVQLIALLDAKGNNLLAATGPKPEYLSLLDMDSLPDITTKDGAYFYRSDDVSATAYFYLDKPENNLPLLPDVNLRIEGMKEKVWSK